VYLQQHIAPLADDQSNSIRHADVKQMAEMMLYDGSTTPPSHFWPTRSVVANRMAAYLRLESGMCPHPAFRVLATMRFKSPTVTALVLHPARLLW
jgi:hypothetical protein